MNIFFSSLRPSYAAEFQVVLRNRGIDAYKNEQYGDRIIVERRLEVDGTTTYKLKDAHGKVKIKNIP